MQECFGSFKLDKTQLLQAVLQILTLGTIFWFSPGESLLGDRELCCWQFHFDSDNSRPFLPTPFMPARKSIQCLPWRAAWVLLIYSGEPLSRTCFGDVDKLWCPEGCFVNYQTPVFQERLTMCYRIDILKSSEAEPASERNARSCSLGSWERSRP